ncbi:MAG: UDP-glucose dehydrogenase family protein [Anaerolineae bacterium]
MNISIWGLGYVGSVSAACLASQGHQVLGVDISADKVQAINSGSSPIIEPGLESLIRRTVADGSLRATQDTLEATKHADVCLVCVGTPSNGNGGLNLQYVERVFEQIGRALALCEGYKVIALRSTVLPTTLRNRLAPIIAQESGKQEGTDYGLASNPEFLREGSAIADFASPPFTLIGQSDERAGSILCDAYAHIAAPIIRTDPDTACMVKYASNAFHALKVAFANEMGRVAKSLGMDGSEVMDIFVQDTKLNISPRYLKPGFAFGGSCLPKDLRALLYLARHNDLQVPVLESILPSNELQIQNATSLIMRERRHSVGIVGLSFKPNTDDLRESPVVELVETLSGKGLSVKIYDENVNLSKLVGGNLAFIERVIPHISALMCPSLQDAVVGSDVVVLAQASENDKATLTGLLHKDQLVIDLVKVFAEENRPAIYEGIGW